MSLKNNLALALALVLAACADREPDHPEARWVERVIGGRSTLICEPGYREPCADIGHVVLPVSNASR